MKTASEVAKLIFHQMEYFTAYPDRRPLVEKEIESILTAYAEERVKEVFSEEIKTGAQLLALVSEEMRAAKLKAAIKQIKQEARAEALEEAAKICESQETDPIIRDSFYYASAIRALKGKP